VDPGFAVHAKTRTFKDLAVKHPETSPPHFKSLRPFCKIKPPPRGSQISPFGGTRQGMVISWPGHIKDTGGIRTQFHHMIDIVPTILEATGIQAPATVNGIAQKPIEGVSMAYTFDQANANALSKRDTQYFETRG
jgi:arylsulfatase A-like enzyme